MHCGVKNTGRQIWTQNAFLHQHKQKGLVTGYQWGYKRPSARHEIALGVTAPIFLKIDSRRRWVVNFRVPPAKEPPRTLWPGSFLWSSVPSNQQKSAWQSICPSFKWTVENLHCCTVLHVVSLLYRAACCFIVVPCCVLFHCCTVLRVVSLLYRDACCFIVVPCCMLFQSLLYCSNSCTSLHFKILKSHTKTL